MKKIYSFILSVVALLFFASCSFDSENSSSSGSSSGDGKKTEPQIQLSMPVISPAAGDYAEGFKEITITSNDSDVDFFYTTDGSDPSMTSSRYTGPFTIIGSKTVKAIAVKGETKTSITTAVYQLNVGKSASQLGVVQGKLALSDSLSEEEKSYFADSTIYIYSSNLGEVIKTAKIGESFFFDGLDTQMTYDFYFTSKEPGTIYGSRDASSKEAKQLKKVVSIKVKVKPENGSGVQLGDVALRPTGKITGFAKKIGEDGNDEEDNAGITVFIPGTSYAAFTDKDGSFTISNVPQGIHTIRAMYSGYTFSEQENISLIEEDDEEIVTNVTTTFELYYARGTVKGTALLSDSSNGNAGIDIILTDSKNAHSYTANTNSSGSWTINDVVPGTYSIELHKDGFEGQVINDIVVTGAKITTIPNVILRENGGKIVGKVNVTSTSNLSGITILAEKASSDWQPSKTYYAISNSEGAFTFESVSPGVYTLTATYAGYKSAVQSDVPVCIGDEIDVGTLLISEKATYSVTGKCVLVGMESGFEGTAVLLQSTTSSENKKSTTTNQDGIFTISDVDSGTYTLTFSHNGFVTDNTKTVDVGTKSIAVVETVVLQTNAGTVIGNVTLESAETQEGISILIYKENDTKTSYTTVTDSTGHYAVAGVKPGSYRVQATKSGYNTGISDPFTVSSGVTSNPSDMLLAISLRSLYGTVKLEGRTDCTGVRITATKTTSTTEIYSALSNKDGFYALSGMTPGEYILSYSYEGYRSSTSSSVSLADDSSLNLDTVELVKATGKISGIVNLEGCADHSGIKVSLVGTNYIYTTEANGSYEFTVPSGNYPGGLRFEREDYQLTAKAETIPVLTDSTYGVLTVEMKATANTLKGVTSLAGSDDASGITVTVDGLDSEKFCATTNAEGSWQLNHIPLGYHKVRFSKLNVPDVTCEVEVVPSDFIDLGKLEMIPDSATLKGYVFLEGMSDNSNISVTVTTKDREDVVVRTSSDGAFTATNILASGNHTITFSKEGWVSQSITISDFEPLEERTIGSAREYVLKDTTAPAWGSTPVTINSGANYANGTKLHVDLSPVEKGSGVEKMSVQLTRTVDGQTSAMYPSTYNWQDYKIGFDFELNELPDQYVGNGTYTLYIALKDKSGNISEKASKSITITDLVTSLSGVLTGDKLHLTEENSPYIVEADCLVSEGDTLVIEPGVEVRFAAMPDENGNGFRSFSISVSGSICARGTKDKKILFTSDYVNQENTYITTEWGEWYDSDGNYQCGDHEVEKTEVTTVYWNGIAINGGSVSTENTYNYVSGNIMEYCEFEYANTPLTIKAGAYINRCNFHDCQSSVFIGYYSLLINNVFESGLSVSTSHDSGDIKLSVINNLIKQYCYFYKWYGIDFDVHNNTFENLTMDISTFYGWNSNNYFMHNLFNNSLIDIGCKASEFLAFFNYNNFIDCSSPIISARGPYVTNASCNFSYNYWGSAQTQELESKGSSANISFISDYYDNFNYARIDYSNWATEPFENCGYSETGFVAFDYVVNGYDIENTKTSLLIEMQPHYSENPITQMRIALSKDELKTAEWINYSTQAQFTVDKTRLLKGADTIYAQVKDSKGNCSSIISHSIPLYGFVSFDYSVNDYDFGDFSGYYPESTTTELSIEISLQYNYENTISQMRLAQSELELESAVWKAYSDNTNFSVDKTKLVNGAATLYVQLKDIVGNCSSAVCHNIPYDMPVCYLSLENGTSFGSAAKKQELRYHITDLGNIISYTLSMDGSRIASESGNSWGTYAGEWNYQLPLAYMASGSHTLKLTATDSAGNTGETTASFTINRNFDESSVKDISYNSTNGQFYKDANTLHLWHLDNDGKEDSGSAEITSYTHTNGGFEGAASVLGGNVQLDVSTNAFTVEFWTRGSGCFELNKDSSLQIHNRYWHVTDFDAYMYHYYETSDGVTNMHLGAYSAARIRSDDQWHFWAYVYDGTYTAIYCDGVCVSYQDGFTHTLNTSNNDLNISASGIVDEIRISNKARSADEINSYYKTAKPILEANTGSLEAIVY